MDSNIYIKIKKIINTEVNRRLNKINFLDFAENYKKYFKINDENDNYNDYNYIENNKDNEFQDNDVENNKQHNTNNKNKINVIEYNINNNIYYIDYNNNVYKPKINSKQAIYIGEFINNEIIIYNK